MSAASGIGRWQHLLLDLFIRYIVRLRRTGVGRFGNASDSGPENVRLHAGGVGRFM